MSHERHSQKKYVDLKKEKEGKRRKEGENTINSFFPKKNIDETFSKPRPAAEELVVDRCVFTIHLLVVFLA